VPSWPAVGWNLWLHVLQ